VINLGTCEADGGDYATARRLFEYAYAQDSTALEAVDNLARLDMLTGNVVGARQRLEGLLRQAPNDAVTMVNLAVLDEREGRPVEALELCRRAKKLAPETEGVADCVARNDRRVAANAPR
jgi:Tfp pilus assembly protein PilF